MAAVAPGSRVHSLDGLRGLAAVIVVFAHSEGVLAREPLLSASIHQSPMALLLNASGAIHLFFVLSGYVLVASLMRGDGLAGQLQFLVRRVFRIHPPYLAGLAFAWLAVFLYLPLSNAEALSSWILDARAVQISAGELLMAVLFPGDASGQLPVGWTLRVEMIFSLCLPLLLWAARQSRVGLLLASVGLLATGSGHYPVQWFALDFSVGIVLSLERDRISRAAARLPGGVRVIVLLVAIAVFTAPEYMLLDFSAPRAAMLVYALGCGLIVISAVHFASVQSFLARVPFRFLGRISYSLYLLHIPVILICLPWAREIGSPLWGWLPFALTVTVITSVLSMGTYWLFEMPAIRVGNAVCKRLATSLGTEQAASRIVSDIRGIAERP